MFLIFIMLIEITNSVAFDFPAMCLGRAIFVSTSVKFPSTARWCFSACSYYNISFLFCFCCWPSQLLIRLSLIRLLSFTIWIFRVKGHLFFLNQYQECKQWLVMTLWIRASLGYEERWPKNGGERVCRSSKVPPLLSSPITNSHQEPVSAQACSPPDPHRSLILFGGGVLRYSVLTWPPFPFSLLWGVVHHCVVFFQRGSTKKKSWKCSCFDANRV